MATLRPNSDIATNNWKSKSGATTLWPHLQSDSDFVHRLDNVTDNPTFTGQVGSKTSITYKKATGGSPPTVTGEYRDIQIAAGDEYRVRVITPTNLDRYTATPFIICPPYAAGNELIATQEVETGGNNYGNYQVEKVAAYALGRGWGFVACRAGNSAGQDNWARKATRDAMVDVLWYIARNWTIDPAGFFLFGPSMGGIQSINILLKAQQNGITIAGVGTLDGVFDLEDMYDASQLAHPYHTHDVAPNRIGANVTIANAYGLGTLNSGAIHAEDYNLTNPNPPNIDQLGAFRAKVDTDGGSGSGVGHNPLYMDLSSVPDTPIRIYYNEGDPVVDSNWNSEPFATRLTGTYSWTDVQAIDTTPTNSHLNPTAFELLVQSGGMLDFFAGLL